MHQSGFADGVLSINGVLRFCQLGFGEQRNLMESSTLGSIAARPPPMRFPSTSQIRPFKRCGQQHCYRSNQTAATRLHIRCADPFSSLYRSHILTICSASLAETRSVRQPTAAIIRYPLLMAIARDPMACLPLYLECPTDDEPVNRLSFLSPSKSLLRNSVGFLCSGICKKVTTSSNPRPVFLS